MICLSTGALLDAAMGPHAGKGTSELGLLRKLLAAFSPGDVMLADAFYCNYFLIAALQGMGVDVLFAQHGARSTPIFAAARSSGLVTIESSSAAVRRRTE